MYKIEQTKLLMEQNLWDVIVEAAVRLPALHKWVQKTEHNKYELKQIYNDSYNLQIMVSNIKQLMYTYIDLLCCACQLKQNSCFVKYNPLDTILESLNELVFTNSGSMVEHDYEYWYNESMWSRSTTVDEFITDCIMVTCTNKNCVHHDDNAIKICSGILPIIQDHFKIFIDGIVLITICENYNATCMWRQRPIQCGIIVCHDLGNNLKHMIKKVLSNKELLKDLKVESNCIDSDTETSDVEYVYID